MARILQPSQFTPKSPTHDPCGVGGDTRPPLTSSPSSPSSASITSPKPQKRGARPQSATVGRERTVISHANSTVKGRPSSAAHSRRPLSAAARRPPTPGLGVGAANRNAVRPLSAVGTRPPSSGPVSRPQSAMSYRTSGGGATRGATRGAMRPQSAKVGGRPRDQMDGDRPLHRIASEIVTPWDRQMYKDQLTNDEQFPMTRDVLYHSLVDKCAKGYKRGSLPTHPSKIQSRVNVVHKQKEVDMKVTFEEKNKPLLKSQNTATSQLTAASSPQKSPSGTDKNDDQADDNLPPDLTPQEVERLMRGYEHKRRSTKASLSMREEIQRKVEKQREEELKRKKENDKGKLRTISQFEDYDMWQFPAPSFFCPFARSVTVDELMADNSLPTNAEFYTLPEKGKISKGWEELIIAANTELESYSVKRQHKSFLKKTPKPKGAAAQGVFVHDAQQRARLRMMEQRLEGNRLQLFEYYRQLMMKMKDEKESLEMPEDYVPTRTKSEVHLAKERFYKKEAEDALAAAKTPFHKFFEEGEEADYDGMDDGFIFEDKGDDSDNAPDPDEENVEVGFRESIVVEDIEDEGRLSRHYDAEDVSRAAEGNLNSEGETGEEEEVAETLPEPQVERTVFGRRIPKLPDFDRSIDYSQIDNLDSLERMEKPHRAAPLQAQYPLPKTGISTDLDAVKFKPRRIRKK